MLLWCEKIRQWEAVCSWIQGDYREVVQEGRDWLWMQHQLHVWILTTGIILPVGWLFWDSDEKEPAEKEVRLLDYVIVIYSFSLTQRKDKYHNSFLKSSLGTKDPFFLLCSSIYSSRWLFTNSALFLLVRLMLDLVTLGLFYGSIFFLFQWI